MRSIGVRPQAILWDVDGTLAETERDGHRVAFNRAFEACGLPWRWDDSYYGPLLRVSGGFERLLHDMRVRTDAPARPEARAALAREIHAHKNAFYGELVRSGAIPLRDGVLELLRQCRDGAMPMGITTTSSRANVDALLAVHLGPDWHAWFAVVICGEDVRHKKPDPEVYVRAVDALGIGVPAFLLSFFPVARPRISAAAAMSIGQVSDRSRVPVHGRASGSGASRAAGRLAESLARGAE